MSIPAPKTGGISDCEREPPQLASAFDSLAWVAWSPMTITMTIDSLAEPVRRMQVRFCKRQHHNNLHPIASNSHREEPNCLQLLPPIATDDIQNPTYRPTAPTYCHPKLAG